MSVFDPTVQSNATRTLNTPTVLHSDGMLTITRNDVGDYVIRQAGGQRIVLTHTDARTVAMTLGADGAI